MRALSLESVSVLIAVAEESFSFSRRFSYAGIINRFLLAWWPSAKFLQLVRDTNNNITQRLPTKPSRNGSEEAR